MTTSCIDMVLYHIYSVHWHGFPIPQSIDKFSIANIFLNRWVVSRQQRSPCQLTHLSIEKENIVVNWQHCYTVDNWQVCQSTTSFSIGGLSVDNTVLLLNWHINQLRNRSMLSTDIIFLNTRVVSWQHYPIAKVIVFPTYIKTLFYFVPCSAMQTWRRRVFTVFWETWLWILSKPSGRWMTIQTILVRKYLVLITCIGWNT